MSEPQLKKRISIPPSLSREARVSLATNIIEHIKDRTELGRDVDGNKFTKYSKSYVASKDFKAAGKSENHVNLRLSEEMMESIELIEEGKGFITIGFEEGSEANNKGVYNQRSDNGPSRLFLGISENDLDLVVAKTQLDLPTEDLSTGLASAILKGLGLL